MSKAVAPISDHLITRHCGFDQFVSRVDKRAKHSSGLAIHQNIPQVSLSPSKKDEPVKFDSSNLHKSKYYMDAQEEFQNRGKPDPNLEKNILAKKEAQDVVKTQLESYKTKKAVAERMAVQKSKRLYSNIGTVSIPPNNREIALFRHMKIVGSIPSINI